MPETLTVIPLEGMPRVDKGTDLARAILDACREQHLVLAKGDVLVVAQKIVSKAEGRTVDLGKITPSPFAEQYAQATGKDARLVEVVLGQTKRIVRMEMGVMICETSHGFRCANAGVDRSNIEGEDHALLLPEDPEASAAGLREALERATGVKLAVVISDTWGRPWRAGLCEFAIGVSGLRPIEDYRGRRDFYGRTLEHTAVAVADELAAAAGLVMRKDAGIPVAIVRGYRAPRTTQSQAARLIRKPKEDLFR